LKKEKFNFRCFGQKVLNTKEQHQVQCLISMDLTFSKKLIYNGILLPNFFWPTVRKNCSSDQEKLLNSRLKAKNLQNLEKIIQTVKGQNNF
jgi:hypothetical protein